jgi:tetratricopeptide (TPR) repeat protein
MLKQITGFPAASIFVCSILALGGCSVNSGHSEAAKAASVVSANETDPEIKSALSAIEKFPELPAVYNQLAIAHIKHARKSGDFSSNAKAEAAVEKALAISANDPTARKLKASLSLTFHRFEEALEQGKLLTAENPKDAFGYGILTDANVELGKYDEAVAAGQQMVDLRPDSNSYARVAYVRSLFGDHNGAVEMYKTAARTADPMDREAQSWCLVQLGNEYFSNGKYAEAERTYDEALVNLPNYYLATAAKARVRAAQNDLLTTVELLKHQVERLPDVESVILLGDVYSRQGNPEAAKVQYQLAEAMEDRLGQNSDKRRLALLWADAGVNLTQSLEIAKLEKAKKSDIFTETVLAWCLYKNGHFTEARDAIVRAGRTKKKDARILYQAGMIEAALDNRAAAIASLEKALKLNPSFDLIQADAAKRKLAELRGGRS